MKKIFYYLALCIVLSSCSDDSPVDQYPQHVDLVFLVESSDESRRSAITTLISNGVNNSGSYDLHIEEKSLSDFNLPYSRTYINQTVKYATRLGLSYLDDSNEFGVPFEPYTITMTIRIDGEVIASDEYEVTESGQVFNTSYLMN